MISTGRFCLSFSGRSIVTGVLGFAAAVSSRTAGGVPTVTVTVAVAVWPKPLSSVYENVASPENPAGGWYRTAPLVNVTVPLAGWVTADTRSDELFGSTSLVSTGIDTAFRYGVVAVSATAAG